MTSGQTTARLRPASALAAARGRTPGRDAVRAPARQRARRERIIGVAMRYFAYRVTLLGNYRASLQPRRQITQFLLGEDPYGTQAFVQFGIDRGEIRTDSDGKIVVSMVGWLMDSCQDAIVTEERDPGLFGSAAQSPAIREPRLLQFVELLRGAIGARP